jgi:hypothetical protein
MGGDPVSTHVTVTVKSELGDLTVDQSVAGVWGNVDRQTRDVESALALAVNRIRLAYGIERTES